MNYHIFAEQQERFKTALLLKFSAFNKGEVIKAYVTPLEEAGVNSEDVIALSLAYNDAGKITAAFAKDKLEHVLEYVREFRISHVYVADSMYFKALTGAKKTEPLTGYAVPCTLKGWEGITAVLGINYQQLIYNPELEAKKQLGIHALATSLNGNYQAIGTGIIHSEHYPHGYAAIEKALNDLHHHPSLSCDIEAFSLKFTEAGVGTITFCWNEHEGIAFPCDFQAHEELDGLHGQFVPNTPVRGLLRKFFEEYKGNLTFHRCTYDVKVLIYTLFMDSLSDTRGLLTGLDIMTRDMDDTLIIGYLATNTTAGNQLSLKTLAQEFAGNWAVEVTDIRRQPLADLLKYNLIDGLCTNFVKKKYIPIMEADNQGDLYCGLFKDSLKLIIQMELTGMPMSRKRIQEVKHELTVINDAALAKVMGSQVIQETEKLLRYDAWQADYEDRRDKAKNPEKIKPKELSAFDDVTFNPNSGQQLQKLLYTVMGLPAIDFTATRQPSTGADTLEKLINHCTDPVHQEVIQALLDYAGVVKILGTFIPAFEGAVSKDGSDTVWLFGCFNLGGTVSGRLSSSDPNLQNIPAGSEYGKLIKTCFISPPGYLFGGADFASLEDYISALTTKDSNKLKVYERGFDGHSLRAAFYFRKDLPHIDLEDPKSVNTIKKTHEKLRSKSKGPTFLLTYGGTFHGLMKNLGWNRDDAIAVEKNYHELYKESDEYIQRRLEQASKDGYVEVAFGLRLRTPLLKQVVFGTQSVPREAAAEGRTAGNAMGQSYGLLNNRAAVAFWKRVWESPYRYDILPVALIHDAIYLFMPNDVEIVEWANNALTEEMSWQELPEIQHPTVKIGAALDLFWPNWATATTLENNATQAQIRAACESTVTELESTE